MILKSVNSYALNQHHVEKHIHRKRLRFRLRFLFKSELLKIV